MIEEMITDDLIADLDAPMPDTTDTEGDNKIAMPGMVGLMSLGLLNWLGKLHEY